MSEIIDILRYQSNLFPQFTVDTTGVRQVPITPTAGGGAICDAAGHERFQKGDSVIILSMGYVLPLCFQLDMEHNVLNNPYSVFFLKAKGKTTAQLYPLNEMLNAVHVPLESYECSLNIFINVMNQPLAGGHNLKDEDFALNLVWSNVFQVFVSMVSVPTALNTTVQDIVPFVKVLHNKPLLP